MILFILRGAFLVLVAAVIVLFAGQEFQERSQFGFAPIASIIGGTLALAAAVIALDVSTKHKRLSAISGIFLGLVAGLVAAYALSFVVELVGVYIQPVELERRAAFNNLLDGIKVILGLVTCYIAISLVLQTRNDFRFVIPYVEFAKEIRGNRPTILDTSVIVDGRILDVIDTRLMQGAVMLPRFVLNELQTIADASDKIKRSRGRRGLDILQKLQDSKIVDVVIDDRECEGTGVDQKLISLAQEIKGRVMTNDFNLNKVATLRGVEVINMNDLAKAMRPVVLPGEEMQVKIIKPGEAGSQGVGYLPDGTMVVVEGARDHLQREVDLAVTSTLQTSAGRMIFGRFVRAGDASPSDPAMSDHHAPPAPSVPESPQPVASKTPSGEGGSAEGRSGVERRRTSASRRNPRRG